MSVPVILRPAAEADVLAIYDELEETQTGLGFRFVERVRELRARRLGVEHAAPSDAAHQRFRIDEVTSSGRCRSIDFAPALFEIGQDERPVSRPRDGEQTLTDRPSFREVARCAVSERSRRVEQLHQVFGAHDNSCRLIRSVVRGRSRRKLNGDRCSRRASSWLPW